jgi:hypothetical protein
MNLHLRGAAPTLGRGRMLRVAAWTGGLFAIGAGVAHYFPGSWTEPLVLAVLGATMLLLGGRDAPAAQRTTTAAPPPQVVPVSPRSARRAASARAGL